jgi:ribosomal protein L39E
MGKKSLLKKKRLIKAHKKTRPVPAFVRLKTARRVSTTPARRHWRSEKLHIRV